MSVENGKGYMNIDVCIFFQSEIALALGHNFVSLWDWKKQEILNTVHCEDKCILYPFNYGRKGEGREGERQKRGVTTGRKFEKKGENSVICALSICLCFFIFISFAFYCFTLYLCSLASFHP